MRENWRITAFEILRRGRGRAKFSCKVDLIDRQVKVALDSLFGGVVESHEVTKEKIYLQRENHQENSVRGKYICYRCKGHNLQGKMLL